MARSERWAGALAAALLVAGVLAALAGGPFGAARLEERFPPAAAPPRQDAPSGSPWLELAAITLGSRDLQGVAAGADGTIAVIAGSELVWLGSDGAVTRRRQLPGPAFCLALSADRIYAGLRDRVAVLGRDGRAVADWGSLGERAWLTSIAVHGANVLVADAGNRLVWRFDLEGRLIGAIGRKDAVGGEEGFVVPSPFFDVAFGPEGELWVVNPGEHRVQRRALDGRLLEAWGRTSLDPGGFSGCCNPSHLAILPDGSFATSEKGVPRVTRHGRDGALLELVAGPASFAPLAQDLDLAVDSQGRILVLDPLRGELRVFARPAGGARGGRGGA